MKAKRVPLMRKRSQFKNHYTVLDIGTEVIKSLIIKREGGQGIVIGASKIAQSLTDMQSGAIADIQSVIDNCDKALAEAEDMCEVIPGQVVMGIAGEQVRGFSTSANVPRANPQTRITKADLTIMLQGVQRRAMREAVRQMSHELGVAEINVRLVHSVVTGVKIDGYPVTNPLDFQGKNLEVSVFNTFAPLTHIGALQTIARELDLELIATVAEPYAVSRACATDETYELGSIFIDVGGGTTDIALVRHGGIEATKMFALGGRAFTKQIATSLRISLEEAERLKQLHSNGDLAPDQRALVHDSVTPNAEIFAHGVALTLEDLAQGEALPSTIYLGGGGALLPELAEQLNLMDWTEQLPLTSPPTISLLKPENIQGIYDTTGLLVSAQDITPMALGNSGLRAEDEAQPLGGLMTRVIKAMKV